MTMRRPRPRAETMDRIQPKHEADECAAIQYPGAIYHACPVVTSAKMDDECAGSEATPLSFRAPSPIRQ